MKKQSGIILTLSLLTIFIAVATVAKAEQKARRDSTVNLDYNPIEIELPPCVKTIAVVKFKEVPPIKYVGISSTFKFKPSPDVGTWMAKALAEQLKNSGYTVKYFETMDEAGDNYIITGIANRVVFERPGEMDIRYKVRLDGMVVKNNKLLFAKNYLSTQEKEMLYTGSNSGKLMAGLHDIFGLFLPEAISAVNQN
ncbi:hypothetical protein [Maridesulfovibrio bastinii]|uniref:hypothetical protein n=1 Tax=Maridesulfovibrio bastinii TaxID=47157 RepID=UPI000424A050|nr:hypothetical protein [Maridesulfovibrio bastinii]